MLIIIKQSKMNLIVLKNCFKYISLQTCHIYLFFKVFKINGIIAGVQKMERARAGVAILLNDVWPSTVIYFGCV